MTVDWRRRSRCRDPESSTLVLLLAQMDGKTGPAVENSRLQGMNTDFVTQAGKHVRLFLLDRARGHPYIRRLLL